MARPPIRRTEVLAENTGFPEETALDRFRVGVGVPIPDPSTRAMLIAGEGLAGVMARRCRH